MHHVSQVDTAFDDLFCRLKLISRLGSQLWLVNLKIKNPRTGKYFIEQTVKPAVTGLLKRFFVDTFTQFANESLHYFCCSLLSGGNRVLKDNCSMQPLILFYLQIEDYFPFNADFLSLQIFVIGRLSSVPVCVGKSFL